MDVTAIQALNDAADYLHSQDPDRFRLAILAMRHSVDAWNLAQLVQSIEGAWMAVHRELTDDMPDGFSTILCESLRKRLPPDFAVQVKDLHVSKAMVYGDDEPQRVVNVSLTDESVYWLEVPFKPRFPADFNRLAMERKLAARWAAAVKDAIE